MTPQEIESIGKVDVEFHQDGYLIGIAAEGANVGADSVAKILERAEEVFGKPFGIIANRKKSYSVAFDAFQLLDKTENLVAFAIVNYNDQALPTTRIEGKMMPRTKFQVFSSLEEAQNWMRSILVS